MECVKLTKKSSTASDHPDMPVLPHIIEISLVLAPLCIRIDPESHVVFHAVILCGGLAVIVWGCGSDLYGGVAVICMGGWQ